jgi:putative membrane protein
MTVAPGGGPPNPGGPTSNELADIRTMLAAQRTLMAWIRTALSMISFGFAIYKFLHSLTDNEHFRLRRPQAPRNMGLFLAGLGTASLIAGLVEYLQITRRLPGPRTRLGSAFYVAVAVVLLGLLVLIDMVRQVGPF